MNDIKPQAIRIADELDEPMNVIDDAYRESISEAAGYLRSMHAEIELLKAESQNHFDGYVAMRAERDALQNRRPKDEAERDAFAAAARPLIEFLSTVHPHHHVLVTPTHAELMEAQMVFKTNEFLKD